MLRKNEHVLLSNLIKFIRKEKNLTQVDIAYILETSQSRISQIERNIAAELKDYINVIKVISTYPSKRRKRKTS